MKEIGGLRKLKLYLLHLRNVLAGIEAG